MPDITIQQSIPVLTGGQYFKVRYRATGSPTWADISPKTNAAFVIYGLSVGSYEIEFIVVLEDGTECPAVVTTFVVRDYECPDFTVEQQESPYGIEITHNVTVDPPCGWVVYIHEIAPAIGTKTINYPTFPASPVFINVAGQQRDLYVQIQANLCDRAKFCFEDDVPMPPAPPECEPMTGFSGTAVLKQREGNVEYYVLTFTGTQSNPITTKPIVIIEQAGTTAPVPKWKQSFYPTWGSPFSFTAQVQYNLHASVVTRAWNIWVIDACGKTTGFTISA